MSLEHHGYLSEDIKEWIDKIRSEHARYFELATETNQLCQKTMFELKAHSKVGQEVITASLYMRCLSTFQSIILLSERGMMPQARILTRALLETVFTLCSICKNEKLVQIYVSEDKAEKLRILSKLKKFHKEKFVEQMEPGKAQEIEKALKADIKKFEIQMRSTEQWAEDAGLSDLYLTAYTDLSHSVHIKVSDLDRHIVTDVEGEVSEFNWGPDDSDLQYVIMISVDIMIVALQAITVLFKTYRDVEIENLRSGLNSLIEQDEGS